MSATTQYLPENITAVLLAAGHGTRMLPLTANTPKPLLKVGNLSLIEHHITRLYKLGFRHIVINIAYLGEQIKQRIGDGDRYGVTIDYSDEQDTGALETAGGLKQAITLINSDPFIVINADIWTDFDFTTLLTPFPATHQVTQTHLGRLVMVKNPEHNPEGDFALNSSGELSLESNSNHHKMTYSGIALYQKALFEQLPAGKKALGPVFKNLIKKQKLVGMEYQGAWLDIGTPERLAALNKVELNRTE